MFVRDLQLKNECECISVIWSGISNLLKPQAVKQRAPIIFTLLGIDIDVNQLHPLKPLISSIPSQIMTLRIVVSFSKALSAISLTGNELR